MTLFWIVCAVLLLVALPFVILPLWRGAGKTDADNGDSDVLHDEANLEILRDQSAELEADLRNGLLTREAYEQGKRELKSRLLEEVKSTEPSGKKPRNPAKVLAVVLAVLLPLSSVSLYLALGNTQALLPQENHGSAEGFGLITSEAKLQELEKELEQQPENPDGWFLLASSYSRMGRFADAARAYEQLVKLVPDAAQLWASYADVYAMNNNQSLLGEPTRFLNKALELDGSNILALALSGSAAMERGDYVAAITHWTKLVNLMSPDNAELQVIRNGIGQAREFLAQQPGGKEKLAELPVDGASTKPADTISGGRSPGP